jgi:hypothetical protein
MNADACLAAAALTLGLGVLVGSGMARVWRRPAVQ